MLDSSDADKTATKPVASIDDVFDWEGFFLERVLQFVQALSLSSIRFLGNRGSERKDSGTSHYEPELCFVLAGRIVVVDGVTREETSLETGDLLFIAPYQVHEIEYLTPGSEVLWISIAPDRMRVWYNVSDGETDERTLHQIDKYTLTGTKRIVESILYEMDRSRERWVEYSKALLAELVALLARSVRADRQETRPQLKRDDDALHRVRVIVGTRYHERLTLEGIAGEAGLSKNYLSTRFRQRFGQSLFVYIAHVRVRHACEYLAKTSSSAQEVARMVGYSNPFYFSRVFKEITGVPPSEYRRRARNPENL